MRNLKRVLSLALASVMLLGMMVIGAGGMMVIGAGAADKTAADLTDIDTSWAEGYIKYCYSNGIITGDGLGHFFPTQGVTVVQAAKMLLVALGYDAEAQEYQSNPN